MKKIYTSILASTLLFTNVVTSQNSNRCGTQAPSANWDAWFNGKVENFKQQQTAKRANGNNSVYISNTYTLPVIFHIIHGGQAVGTFPNLDSGQINSQIKVLNQDYAGVGYNANTYPATAFQAYAAAATNSVSPASKDASLRVAIANTGISFALATKDPNGNTLAEPGIERVNYVTKGWSNPASTNYNTTSTFQNFIDGTVKPGTIWDVTKYFNIWITDENANVGLLGYATFPPGSTLTALSAPYGTATTDGCWFWAKVVGSKNIYPAGTYDPTYCYGRTICHETGHYLGLRHPWGDNGACNGSDYCNDTPPEKGLTGGSPAGSYYGCPTYPSQAGTCTYGGQTNTDGDMFMNIMDYTDDACMYMFTYDQTTRMHTAMANSPFRSGLSVSSACYANFTSSNSFFATSFTNSSPGYFNHWFFGDGDTSSVANPVHTYSANGTYTVTLQISRDSLNTDTCSISKVINVTPCPTPIITYTIYPDTALTYWDIYYSSGYASSITWYWGDGTNSSAAYPSHTYNAPGVYNICATAFNTCGDSTQFCLMDSIYRLAQNNSSTNSTMTHVSIINGTHTTGIKQTVNNTQVSVYPNPNNGLFYIKLNNYENTSLEIYNTIGQKVLTQNLSSNVNQLNMNTFNNGIYQVRILKNNNLVYQTKLIKQD